MDANFNFEATIVLERDICITINVCQCCEDPITKATTKQFWKPTLAGIFGGPKGAYLRQTYLLAFVEEIGAQDLWIEQKKERKTTR